MNGARKSGCDVTAGGEGWRCNRVAKKSHVASLIGTLYNIGCGGGKQAYIPSR